MSDTKEKFFQKLREEMPDFWYLIKEEVLSKVFDMVIEVLKDE